jgi:polyhydroxyalkanoate synthesis regulator phasin
MILNQATTIHELKKRIEELEKPVEELELELDKYIKEQEMIENLILAQASTIEELQKRIVELEKPALWNKKWKWKNALRICRSSWSWF